MNSSLSIDHSSLSEKLNMTDYLHQIRIGLKTNPSKDDVCNFLKESMKHLDNNFDTNLANELFPTITSCFSRYPNELLNIFDDIYQKSKTNSNYFILSIFIINELYHNQININDYKSLISDSLKEILPQIQSKFLEKFLKIFDVEIPYQFQNDLIIDLINCSNLNEDIIFEVFPYIIANNIKSQNQKIILLQEKMEKFDFNKILELNNISNQEIFEFINTKDYELLSGFNKSSLSLLISAFLYIKSHGKIKIKGLNKDNILQFTSILIIFLECQQNYQPFSNSDINDCLKDEIKSLKSKNSIILDKFNEFILSNYSILLHYQLLSYNDLLQIIEVMTQQIPNKTISLNVLFELSNQIQFTNKQFFKDFNDDIKNLKQSLFNNIVSNLIYINNNYDGFKNPKFNLESVDSSTIFNLLENSKSFDEISNILYFIDNLCSNHFNITTSNDFSNCLKNIYEDNINLEKSSNSNLIQNYINKFKIKKSNEINKEKTINDIIEYILNEQNPETNDNLFEILFDKMMENQQLSENFIGFCLNKDTDLSYKVDDFLKIHLLEYINYQDCFIKMTNKRYFYIGKDRILTLNPNYRTSNLEIPEIGTSIVETLFDKIDQQPNNFQAFFILKNIASSFPNIFLKNYQKVFDNVLRSFDNFYLIYEKNLTNEQLQMAKTSYSAFSFLLSTFQSSLILDEFTKWLFTNISNFSNSQIIGFISIITLCLIDTKISFIINTYITKYNFLETLGNLINRNLENCSYKNVYLESIYSLVNQIYDTYTKYNENVSVQIEEFTNIDNPFNYIFEISFNCFPYCFLSEIIGSNRLNHQISKFIDNTNRPRKFWLNYTIDKKQNRVNLDQVNNFISKLPKYEPYTIPSYVKKFEDKFTIKMIRNLVLKSYLIYGWFLYPKNTHFIQETGELIVNAFMNLNDILNETDNNNKEDQNIKTYDVSEYLFQYYCQPNLIENLFNQTNLGSIDNKCFLSLCKAIYLLSQNDVCLLSILEIISNCIKDSIANESISSKRTMYRLVDILILISKSECFEQNFFDLCQNYLINAALSINYRNDSQFIMKVTNLFSFLIIDFSSPIKNLIEVILTMDNIESIEPLIKLYSKFDNVKSTNFQELSYYAFDKEIKKSQNTKIIIDLINYYPSLIQEKYTDLLSFLDDQLHKFFKTEQKHGNPLNDICFLFNKLAPRRGDFPNLIESEENEYIIPPEFVEKSPQFWQLFGKYREKIDKMIQEDFNILDKLYFIIDFPELIKFNIRSSLIKKLLKSKIKFSTIKLRVDFDNILASSYIQLHNKQPNQLLNDFEICIPNSIVHDTGGVKREWFTKLAKEIFNQNYGLFDCCEKTMSYQPSPNSYIHPNHIEYFRFIGQFVARSLIEGICIDAHFTPSFLKQILHYKLDMNDLKDVDEELYRSSEWILQNDVDPLDLYFEIDTNEFGENKTVPLKENGSEIKVTNENKKEFIQLRTDYVLFNRIEKQVNAFREGFESLIDYDSIKVFTPKELDLLIVGSQEFDVKDFIDHFSYDYPFTEETPVVKLFFNAISKWNKDDLQKLLMFMTGSSRVPINGFDEFCKMSGKTFKIGSGGDKSNLPQSHTCANTINLPHYETEDELNEKLHMAINECITYENV